jgi:hypothetical protein
LLESRNNHLDGGWISLEQDGHPAEIINVFPPMKSWWRVSGRLKGQMLKKVGRIEDREASKAVCLKLGHYVRNPSGFMLCGNDYQVPLALGCSDERLQLFRQFWQFGAFESRAFYGILKGLRAVKDKEVLSVRRYAINLPLWSMTGASLELVRDIFHELFRRGTRGLREVNVGGAIDLTRGVPPVTDIAEELGFPASSWAMQ